MPQGGAIQIRVENVTVSEGEPPPVAGLSASRYVKLEIEDHGGGIADDHKPRIFDPYFSTKPRGTQKGMGLGLSTTLSIVEKHSGVLHIESVVDKGTIASVYLRASKEQVIKKGPAATTSSKVVEPLNPLRILLMDDEPQVQTVAQKMLGLLGHEADTVGDSQAAIEAYRLSLQSAKPYDIVMLDLTVRGGAGGRETIGELLKLNPDLIAIVFSGFATDPVMAYYRDYGFRAAFAKPFQVSSLDFALRKALDT
jgi:CheY-like chemotaxis protein